MRLKTPLVRATWAGSRRVSRPRVDCALRGARSRRTRRRRSTRVSTLPFTFTPATGYMVRVMQGDDVVALTGTNQFTLSALTADLTISLAFPLSAPAIGTLKTKAGKR
jgi:hypothetical protein